MSISNSTLTQARLKQVLAYDEKTGDFYRLSNGFGRPREIGSVAGCIDNVGYRRIKIDGRRYQAHWLVWMYVHGAFPKTGCLDHIDHDRSNNRIDNLRESTNQTNCQNRTKETNTLSGRIGVGFFKDVGKWSAQITVSGNRIYLGSFGDLDDAILAREKAEAEHFIW